MPKPIKPQVNDMGERVHPREQKLRDLSLHLARKIDGELGGEGFCLLVFNFGANGFTAYASNADRSDMRKALQEHLRKTETYDEMIERTKSVVVLAESLKKERQEAKNMRILLDRIGNELARGKAPMNDTWWASDHHTMLDEIAHLLGKDFNPGEPK